MHNTERPSIPGWTLDDLRAFVAICDTTYAACCCGGLELMMLCERAKAAIAMAEEAVSERKAPPS